VKIFALSDLRVTMGQKGGKGNTAGARSERVVRGEGKGRSCRLDRDAAGLIRNERSGSLRGRTSNKPRLSCRRWRRRYQMLYYTKLDPPTGKAIALPAKHGLYAPNTGSGAQNPADRRRERMAPGAVDARTEQV